jgi:hypothetical protein
LIHIDALKEKVLILIHWRTNLILLWIIWSWSHLRQSPYAFNLYSSYSLKKSLVCLCLYGLIRNSYIYATFLCFFFGVIYMFFTAWYKRVVSGRLNNIMYKAPSQMFFPIVAYKYIIFPNCDRLLYYKICVI